MENKKTIAETLELMEGLKIAAVSMAKIAKDKKVNAEDLVHLVELASEFEVMVKAFNNLSEVPEELKDLDENEIVSLITKIYSIGNEVKKAMA
jgi:copper homeostasis protein CutC